VGIRKSDSIKEQIKKIENEGKTFNNEAMTELLLVVSKQNIVGTDIPPVIFTRAQRFHALIENFRETSNLIPEPLCRLLSDVMNTTPANGTTEESDELRGLRNYLLGVNKNVKKQIISFITKHSDLSKDRISEFSSFLNTIMNWSDNRSRNKLNMTDGDLYNSINFMKTYLHNFARIFPNIILANKPDKFNKKFRLPRHWGISRYDDDTIKASVKEYYDPLNEFFDNQVLIQPLSNIQRKMAPLLKIIDETPYASIIDPSSQTEVLKVFDRDTSLYLFEYYFLTIVNEYINETATVTRTGRLPRTRESESAHVFSADVNDSVVNFEMTQEREFVSELNEGEKKQIKMSVAKLLTVYVDIMLTHKLTVNISYSYIMENVFKIQRAETRTFTERLELLKDDEREADTALKILKLGKWSKGLQKTMTVYNKNVVDLDALANNERYQGIEQAVRLNKRNEGIVDADIDIDQAVEDYLEEAGAEERDRLELGMGGIGEDYYDGDPYGDEYLGEVD